MSGTSDPERLEKAVRSFDLDGALVGIEPLHRGHIHDTFVSTWTPVPRPGPEAPGGGSHGVGSVRYLHQRMNDAVFTDIPSLMHNVAVVTEHLGSRDDSASGLTTLRLVRARDGGAYSVSDGDPWRTYDYVEGTATYDHPKSVDMAYAAAEAFGGFQARLTELDSQTLRETIPNFFDSEARLAQLEDACRRDPVGRRASVGAELGLIEERRLEIPIMGEALRSARMPERVIHGDTKLNNVLFDAESDRPRCIVDLDTCMPGYSLFDFGDLVRFTAATADEDEQDLGKVDVNLEVYGALREGYLRATDAFLTPFEREHMALAARLVTLTLGMRFLADHIRGDKYFKVDRPGHNLDRARVQLHLVEQMEARLPG